MTFAEVRSQVLELLQRQGRVSYRALKRQFALDDDYLEDLKEELLFSQQEIRDEDGRGLVWTGDGTTPPQQDPSPSQVQSPSTYTPQPHCQVMGERTILT